MSLAIENSSDRRVLVRFNSGRTRHLAPGEVVEPVEPAEVRGNDRIGRLEARRLVEIRDARRSGDMTADEAIEQIRETPLGELEDFLSPDEERKTVLEAMRKKRKG